MSSASAERLDFIGALSGLRAEIAVWRAASVARTGRYDEAEALLRGVSLEDTPAALDLLARIHAQQGRLAEAASLWARVTQAQPGHGVSHAALDRINRTYRQSGTPKPLLLLAGALSVGVLLMGGWLAQRSIRRTIEGVDRRVQAFDSNSRRQVPAPPPKTEPAPIVLSLPGTLVEREHDDTVVTFQSDVFSRGTVLTAEGRNILAAFGHQLAAVKRPMTVTIVGLTDDLPLLPGARYRDNAALGFARAAAALVALRGFADVDPAEFQLRVTDPRGEETGRRRTGRTIMFYLTRRQS